MAIKLSEFDKTIVKLSQDTGESLSHTMSQNATSVLLVRANGGDQTIDGVKNFASGITISSSAAVTYDPVAKSIDFNFIE